MRCNNQEHNAAAQSVHPLRLQSSMGVTVWTASPLHLLQLPLVALMTAACIGIGDYVNTQRLDALSTGARREDKTQWVDALFSVLDLQGRPVQRNSMPIASWALPSQQDASAAQGSTGAGASAASAGPGSVVLDFRSAMRQVRTFPTSIEHTTCL